MKSPITAKSLLIQFDEHKHVIRLLVPQRASDLNTFSVLCEIADKECNTRQNLESRIGRAVLAYLSAEYDSISFFLDDFREAGRIMKAEMAQESASFLASDNVNERFEGVMLLIHDFSEAWQLEDIEKVTVLFRQIAEQGSEQAGEYLKEDWPKLSEIFKRRLNRKKRQPGTEVHRSR
jgi:uncharacterized glyoxalase superfamily protein PhnB